VDSTFSADVVPAIQIGASYATDPISIYSFRARTERKNYPRVHAANNTTKHQQTNMAYKPLVRMFKRWVAQWFPGMDVAPSFYVECLVHNAPNQHFDTDYARAFFNIAYWVGHSLTRHSVIHSVAGDKDILVAGEWDPDKFIVFQNRLSSANGYVAMALQADSAEAALKYWKAAFND
jgi:hypothetical protein